MLSCDVALVQRAEVCDQEREEVPDLDAVLVVHEHRGVGLAAGNEDLRHEPEALANDDAGGNGRITSRCPIGGVCPLGDGQRDNTARVVGSSLDGNGVNCRLPNGG